MSTISVLKAKKAFLLPIVRKAFASNAKTKGLSSYNNELVNKFNEEILSSEFYTAPLMTNEAYRRLHS